MFKLSWLNRIFGKQKIHTLIDSQSKAEIQKHNKQVNKDCEILKRLIDAVCYLAKQELPFHGQDESSESANKGNYMELFNLLRNYDSLLDTYLSTSSLSRNFPYCAEYHTGYSRHSY